MLVYKFYPAKWGIAALERRRLKVSAIDSLNDPFEYLSLDLGQKDVRAWARQFRKSLLNYQGIISFSCTWRQPLMWAHYADSHKGIALGFEVPKALLFEINYVGERLKPPANFDESPVAQKELFNKLLRTKHKEWAYEKEFRLMRPLGNCEREDNLFFASFCADMSLKEIILGARYESSQLTELQCNLEAPEGVKIKTARAKFKGFQMTEQRLPKLQSKL